MDQKILLQCACVGRFHFSLFSLDSSWKWGWFPFSCTSLTLYDASCNYFEFAYLFVYPGDAWMSKRAPNPYARESLAAVEDTVVPLPELRPWKNVSHGRSFKFEVIQTEEAGSSECQLTEEVTAFGANSKVEDKLKWKKKLKTLIIWKFTMIFYIYKYFYSIFKSQIFLLEFKKLKYLTHIIIDILVYKFEIITRNPLLNLNPRWKTLRWKFIAVDVLHIPVANRNYVIIYWVQLLFQTSSSPSLPEWKLRTQRKICTPKALVSSPWTSKNTTSWITMNFIEKNCQKNINNYFRTIFLGYLSW